MAANFLRKLWHGSAESRLAVQIELAHDLTDQGRDDEAAALCDELLDRHREQARLLHLKGVLALRAGSPQTAKQLIGRAIVQDPSSHLYRFNLGNALTATLEHSAAIAAFDAAVRLKPDHVPGWFNLGKAQLALNRIDEAIRSFGQLARILPNDAATLVELGFAWYRKAGDTRLPADYRRAIDILDAALALSNLTPTQKDNALLFSGDALDHCRQHTEALSRFRQVLQHDPDNLDAIVKCANSLNQLGRIAEALPYYQRVTVLKPDQLPAYSSIISAADYLPQINAAENTRQRLALAAKLSTPLRRTAWPNSRSAERRLRIGYVSPNLCTHVAMYLFEAVLRLHDRRQFEWFVYDATPDRDQKTATLRALMANWREIDAQPVTQLPAMIEADQIDILVDLAGHTSNNRLMAFAFKPAPVQVSWLAYPGSTGMKEVDYLISDAHTTPAHLTQHAAEKVWCLPGTRFSYEPPAACAAPALPSPDQPITFACFNNLSKLNPVVLSLWRKILDEVPASRLRIKSAALDDAGGRDFLAAGLDTAGIAVDRVDLQGATSYLDNFANYNGVHIALDPFPFCGGLTSLDALWMGVPVITLEQELMAGRQTLAFLYNIGHPELIASTPDDYVRIAVELARNPEAIANYRTSLRDAMRASPLLDHASLTRNLEAAYRAMWQSWCGQAA